MHSGTKVRYTFYFFIRFHTSTLRQLLGILLQVILTKKLLTACILQNHTLTSNAATAQPVLINQPAGPYTQMELSSEPRELLADPTIVQL